MPFMFSPNSCFDRPPSFIKARLQVTVPGPQAIRGLKILGSTCGDYFEVFLLNAFAS